MKKKVKQYWPFLLLFACWFLFATPYFLKGKVPFSSTYLVNFFPPWSYYREFWGPIKNNAMPDVNSQMYPWRKLAIDSYKERQIPLWNPYSFSGNPLLANYQSAVLSPFNMLFFILPFVSAWSILVLLQPFLAGIFTYLFLREISVSKTGSLLGSVTFMFCGFIVVWMAYGTLSMVMTFLPLSLFAIERSFRKYSLFSLLLLSASLCVSFFSGHFQMSLYLTGFAFLFFMFKVSTVRNMRKSLCIGIFFFLGIILSFAQLLPSIVFYQNSVRSNIFATGGGIPLQYLVNIFSPDFYGNPVTRNDWFGYYAEWASFVGIIPLLLFCFAVFSKTKNKYVIFFLVTSITTFLLAIDSPLQKVIEALHIPVLSTSIPSRIIVLFSFSLAVLSGFGLDALKEIVLKRERRKILIPLLLISLILSGIWVWLLLVKPFSPEKLLIAKRNMMLPTFFFLGSTIAVFLPFFNKKFLFISVCFLLLMASFDSVRFAQKWMPFDPPQLMYPRVAIIDAIQKHIGDGRLFGNFGSELSVYYKIPSIEGYDPLYIGRYGEFIRSASEGQFIEGERSVVKIPRIGRYTDRALDLLGVSLVFHPIADTNQGWAYPVWKDTKRYSLVYKDDKFQLFKNNQVLPRASLFYNIEVIKDSKDEIRRFYSDSFNFRNTLLLEQPVEGIEKIGTGSAEIRSYTPNKILISTTTSEPALLFLADNYYPGWKAKVNGSIAKIFRADYTFRAVLVPKGTSTVELTYENWYF